MRTDHLLIEELIDHVLMFSTDPVARRLAHHIASGLVDDLVDDLARAGMDAKTCMFDDIYSPGTYIRNLEYDVADLRDELDKANQELERLSTRTMLSVMQELQREADEVRVGMQRQYASIRALEESNAELTRKLDMWGRLNQVKAQA